jgi:hypothetical protein
MSSSGLVMIAESRQVAFTKGQWEAYEFVLNFHRLQSRAPTAVELGRGLGITLVESTKLIGALTAKGVLERRVYHVLAIVPPSYHRQEFAEV